MVEQIGKLVLKRAKFTKVHDKLVSVEDGGSKRNIKRPVMSVDKLAVSVVIVLSMGCWIRPKPLCYSVSFHLRFFNVALLVALLYLYLDGEFPEYFDARDFALSSGVIEFLFLPLAVSLRDPFFIMPCRVRMDLAIP